MGVGLSREDNVGPCPQFVFSVRGRLYRTLSLIGQGSEATVYQCEDQNAMQHAVKVFDFSRFPRSEMPRRVESFNREAQLLKILSRRSQHFIHLIDFEYKPEETVGYMIMELGEGNLRQHLQGYPMTDGMKRNYWKQIVTILKALEDARIVHADIKPDNMILVNNILKVTDLGLAFRLSSADQLARREAVRGTLDYMAPEVFQHHTGFKSDVWSAGIILYEMTYGRPPYFSITDRNQKVAVISSMTPIPFPPLHNRYLLDLIRRCLQFDARLRPNAYQLKAHPYARI